MKLGQPGAIRREYRPRRRSPETLLYVKRERREKGKPGREMHGAKREGDGEKERERKRQGEEVKSKINASKTRFAQGDLRLSMHKIIPLDKRKKNLTIVRSKVEN